MAGVLASQSNPAGCHADRAGDGLELAALKPLMAAQERGLPIYKRAIKRALQAGMAALVRGNASCPQVRCGEWTDYPRGELKRPRD